MSQTNRNSSFWFERFYSSLRLPTLVGEVIFGSLLFVVALFAASAIAGVSSDMATRPIAYFVPFAMFAGSFSQYCCRVIQRAVERLKEYSLPMTGGSSPDLGLLYSFPKSLLTWLIALVAIQPLYILFGLPQGYSIVQRIVISLPFFYWNLFMSTFLWVWSYSLYYVFRMGKDIRTLKPFTQDRTLGLKPFGRASLLFTVLSLLLVTIVVLPNIFLGFSSLPLLGYFVTLYILTTFFFLLPLFPLRRKLQQEKRKLLDAIGLQYTSIYKKLEPITGKDIDEHTVHQLLALDKLQRDAQLIHSWPFDTGIIFRLSAVLLSVAAIMISRIIQLTLHL